MNNTASNDPVMGIRNSLLQQIDALRNDRSDERVLTLLDSLTFQTLHNYVNGDTAIPDNPLSSWMRAARWDLPDAVVAEVIAAARGYLLDMAGLGKAAVGIQQGVGSGLTDTAMPAASFDHEPYAQQRAVKHMERHY